MGDEDKDPAFPPEPTATPAQGERESSWGGVFGPSGADKGPPEPSEPEPHASREEGVESVASRLGLRYLRAYPRDDDPCGIWELPYRWMKRRRQIDVSNVVFGTYQGIDICEFDYAFYGAVSSGSEYGGTSSWGSSAIASCAFVTVPAAFPRLSILPRGNLGPITRLLRVGEVRLDRTFTHSFFVKARDRGFARRLLHPHMRSMILGPQGDAAWLRPPDAGMVAFQITGRWIGASCGLVNVDDLEDWLLRPMKAFVGEVPLGLIGEYALGSISR